MRVRAASRDLRLHRRQRIARRPHRRVRGSPARALRRSRGDSRRSLHGTHGGGLQHHDATGESGGVRASGRNRVVLTPLIPVSSVLTPCPPLPSGEGARRSCCVSPLPKGEGMKGVRTTTDRKSTRLNSSHITISYAVFCLKRKK